jgi:hypothetical protein
MKVVKRIISIAGLSLLLGIVVPAYAQHEEGKQDHPAKEQNKEQNKPQPQHEQRQQHAQQPQQHTQQQPQQHTQQQPRHAQQERQDQQQAQQQQRRQNQNKPQQQRAQQQRQDQNNRQERDHQQPHAQQQRHDQNRQGGYEQARNSPEQHRVQQSAWQEHRSQHWDSDHRSWQQRGGYHGYRVPDDRYRGYFGPEHGFRIGGLPFRLVGGYPRFRYNGYWISTLDPWPEYWGDNWYDNDDVYVAYVDNGYYMYNRRYPNAGVAISISF